MKSDVRPYRKRKMNPLLAGLSSFILVMASGVVFGIALLVIHIVLSVYYFESGGATTSEQEGFLRYAKRNSESFPIQSIVMRLQHQSSYIMNRTDVPIFRWAGNQAGYKCLSTYSNTTCSATLDSNNFAIRPSSVKDFYFIHPTDQTTQNLIASFEITRCPDSTCSTISVPRQFAMPSSRKLDVSFVEIASTNPTYVKQFQLIVQNSNLLFDSNYFFYTMEFGSSFPCYNEDLSSALPPSVSFPLYVASGGCGRFSSQNTTVTLVDYANILNLNARQFFQLNEMNIALMAAGVTIPSTETLNMYLIPSFQQSLVAASLPALSCAVQDDLSIVYTYATSIKNVGLILYVFRQIVILGVISLPIAEIFLYLKRNRHTTKLSFASKGVCFAFVILLLVEGSIIRWNNNFKVGLQNSIRNLGWRGCFQDKLLNRNFMRVPSLFEGSLDDFTYISYLCLWMAGIVFTFLFLLLLKFVLDLYVHFRHKYGLYDADNSGDEGGYAYNNHQMSSQYYLQEEDQQNTQAVNQQVENTKQVVTEVQKGDQFEQFEKKETHVAFEQAPNKRDFKQNKWASVQIPNKVSNYSVNPIGMKGQSQRAPYRHYEQELEIIRKLTGEDESNSESDKNR